MGALWPEPRCPASLRGAARASRWRTDSPCKSAHVAAPLEMASAHCSLRAYSDELRSRLQFTVPASPIQTRHRFRSAFATHFPCPWPYVLGDLCSAPRMYRFAVVILSESGATNFSNVSRSGLRRGGSLWLDPARSGRPLARPRRSRTSEMRAFADSTDHPNRDVH